MNPIFATVILVAVAVVIAAVLAGFSSGLFYTYNNLNGNQSGISVKVQCDAIEYIDRYEVNPRTCITVIDK